MRVLPFAFACHPSSAWANVCPRPWMQKSTWHVVPPHAADPWPDSKSSSVTVPPNGMSRCVWVTLRGESERRPRTGGHMVSVPNGGWLGGCLDVLAGVEVLRRVAEEGRPPLTVRLVDWADEEGARCGRSRFGSSAGANSMADQ